MDACPALPAAPIGQDLIQQIVARLPQLSPIMRSIGGYCVRTHAWLHLMSIDEVAGHCGTVPSSVVRFARLFGHRGFHDFKVAFVSQRPKPVDAGLHGRLLSHLDEDVYQLSELRTLLQEAAFQTALGWIRAQPRLTLTFHGELDRLVAMHLGDALQRSGKFVLLADPQQAHAKQAALAQVTSIHLDLERPRLPAERPPEADHQIDLLGTVAPRACHASSHRLTLPVSGSTLGQRLQKALSIADTIETALQ